MGKEMINSPKHYCKSLFETIDEMLIVFGANDTEAFCRLNAWKYRARAGYKDNNSREQDLAKADEYIKYAYQIQNLGRIEKLQLLKNKKEV